MADIEKIFSLESENYDSKHKLNTCNKVVSDKLLREIENGCSLETLEEIAKGYDIFKYRTQITIHGLFPELSTNRIGYYMNLFQNKNKSIGVRYTAIDYKKKWQLFNIVKDCTDYRVKENSTEFMIKSYSRLDMSSDSFREQINKAVEEIKRIDKSLFYGSANVFIEKNVFGGVYLVKVININCFYEKNFKKLVEQICGMSYDEAMNISTQKYLKEKEEEMKRKIQYANLQAEAKRKEEERKSKIEELKKTTPPPIGFIATENITLQSGDIVARARFNHDGKIRWKFWKIIKSFGRLIIKACDENGNIDVSKTGTEVLKKEYTGYIKMKIK